MHHVRSAAADPRNVGIVEVDAVAGQQAIVQQAQSVQQLYGGTTVSRTDPVHFVLALSKVGADRQVVPFGKGGYIAQQIHRTGVRRVGGQVCLDTAVSLSRPLLYECGGALQLPLATGAVEAAVAIEHRGEIDIGETLAGEQAHAGFRHAGDGGFGMYETVDQRGAAGAQCFQGTESGQGERFFLAQP